MTRPFGSSTSSVQMTFVSVSPGFRVTTRQQVSEEPLVRRTIVTPAGAALGRRLAPSRLGLGEEEAVSFSIVEDVQAWSEMENTNKGRADRRNLSTPVES